MGQGRHPSAAGRGGTGGRGTTGGRGGSRGGQPSPPARWKPDALDLDQLRAFRVGLRNEENQISYLRRVVHARLDHLERTGRDLDGLDRYRDVFESARAGPGSHLSVVLPPGEVPRVPDMADVWGTAVDPTDATGYRSVVERLEQAERELSEYRAQLHRYLDAATAELITRYREDPSQTLSLLPRDTP